MTKGFIGEIDAASALRAAYNPDTAKTAPNLRNTGKTLAHAYLWHTDFRVRDSQLCPRATINWTLSKKKKKKKKNKTKNTVARRTFLWK